MTNTIFFDPADQAGPAKSPQLRDPDTEHQPAAPGVERPPSLWPLITALHARLDESEARAEIAAFRLALRRLQCTCGLVDVSAEEASAIMAHEFGRPKPRAADPGGNL